MNLNGDALLNLLPLTQIGPETFVFLVPITALLIPIVAILVKHQQRMAEIIHGTARQQGDAEIAQLRSEVYELKQLVHQQMISVDSLVSSQVKRLDIPIQDRLEQR